MALSSTPSGRTAILLTASIDAAPSSKMTETTRLKQYEWSVRGWCRRLHNLTRLALVIVENTDADLSPLVDAMGACSQPHEVVRAPRGSSHCKGHGEMESILYARKASLVLRRAERIVKVTGRYVLPDLPRHLDGDWMALRQNALLPGMRASVHCEIVGAHRSVFDRLFSRKTRLCHVEKVYEARFRAIDCKHLEEHASSGFSKQCRRQAASAAPGGGAARGEVHARPGRMWL